MALSTGLVLTPFVLHHLGATKYGLWVLVGSVTAYGSLLDFGIVNVLVKYVAEYRAKGHTEDARSLIATALRLYSGLGLIAILLSALLAPFFPDLFDVPAAERASAAWLVVVMGAGVGISIPCTTATAVLRGLQRFDIVNLIRISGTLLYAAGTVAVLLLGHGLLGMVGVGIAVSLLAQVVSIRAIHRVEPELRFGWRGARRRWVGTILSFSWLLFTGQVAGRLQTRTDEIVIAAVLPLGAVSAYALCRRLSELGQFLTGQFLKVLLPLASELHTENDGARLRALYLTSGRLTLALFTPVGGAVLLLARPSPPGSARSTPSTPTWSFFSPWPA